MATQPLIPVSQVPFIECIFEEHCAHPIRNLLDFYIEVNGAYRNENGIWHVIFRIHGVEHDEVLRRTHDFKFVHVLSYELSRAPHFTEFHNVVV
jgi:hypothetical protein